METDENLWKPMKDGQGYAYRTAMRLSAARRRPASVLSNFVSGAAKNESATVKKRPARRPQTGGASIPYHHPSKKPSMSSMGGLQLGVGGLQPRTPTSRSILDKPSLVGRAEF